MLSTRLNRLLQRFRSPGRAEVFSFHQENVLGTSFELRVRSLSPHEAEKAECRALAEIDRLEKIFSSFDPASEFRQWQRRRGRETAVSSELMAVLQACEFWQKQSGGAFSPASEAFSRLWKKAIEEKRRPSPDALARIVEQVEQPLWRLDPAPAGRTATYLSECPLTLNGIAKGYIVDRACDAAFTGEGAIQALTLNIGGDLRIRSDREEIAGVTDPDNDAENAPLFARVRLQNGALATSGDWRRGFRLGETLYSHILDPRSGIPVERVRSASVIAPCTADTDALATIFSVLTPDESMVLADSLPGVGCLLIARDGQAYRSAEWRKKEIVSA